MSPALTVLFGTTTGNAEDCAVRAARHLESLGLPLAAQPIPA